MQFEWDSRKAAGKREKHNIDFADAVTVFDDLNALTHDDPFSEEERFATMGRDAYGRIVVVIYTWRGDTIRIISARKATKRECKHYEG